jgi:hypothetical protein
MIDLIIFLNKQMMSMFDSIVTAAFQIIFCAEIHINNVFSFLKIIFDINTSKRSKTYKTY